MAEPLDNTSSFGDRIRAIMASGRTKEVSPLDASHLRDAALDRKLKKQYARGFIYILIGQLFLMNTIFALAGCKILNYEPWTLDIFMSGTLAEVFGVVVIITKNLFPRK